MELADEVDDEAIAPGLTKVERAMLGLEQAWWKYPGAKEAAVLERFGWSMTRYYQVLTTLIDKPAALESAPVTVNRLRRLREDRRRARTQAQLASGS